MEIKKQNQSVEGLKFFIEKDGQQIGRAFLYLIHNGLHAEPYGLLEDVFVEESYRGQGIGSELVRAVIAEAKAKGCYKLIGTSRAAREQVHQWYQQLGFVDYGKEFRLDLV